MLSQPFIRHWVEDGGKLFDETVQQKNRVMLSS